MREEMKKMADKTCETCIENDNGLCDRKGILIEEDDTCEKHISSWKETMMENFIRKNVVRVEMSLPDGKVAK